MDLGIAGKGTGGLVTGSLVRVDGGLIKSI